jgi:hypothetical protein
MDTLFKRLAPILPIHKTFKTPSSMGKVMPAVLFYINNLLKVAFRDPDITINTHCWGGNLRDLHTGFNRQHQSRLTAGANMPFNETHPQFASTVQNMLHCMQWMVMDPTPHRLELSMCVQTLQGC